MFVDVTNLKKDGLWRQIGDGSKIPPFALLPLLGFSVNTLSLLGLVVDEFHPEFRDPKFPPAISLSKDATLLADDRCRGPVNVR
jgi:hypothetical protein